jgi:hypothetical protein
LHCCSPAFSNRCPNASAVNVCLRGQFLWQSYAS